MKKLLVLVMAVAIVGTAFAETDPVFSGTFKAWYGYSLSGERSTSHEMPDKNADTSSPVDADDAMSLDLNAVIDDYNTVNVKFKLDDAMYDKNKDADYIDPLVDPNKSDADKAINEYDQRGDYVRMETYTLTSDILGALGVTGPVGLTAKFGKFAYKPVSVVNVAPLSTKNADGTDGTADEVGIALDVKFIDMITLSVGLYPQQLVAKKPEMGVNLKIAGIADMIDIAAYYVMSSYNTKKIQRDGDKDDEHGDSLGASVAVSIGEMVKIGVGMEYNLEDLYIDEANQQGVQDAYDELTTDAAKAEWETSNRLKLQVDVGFTLGNLGLGLSAGITGLDDADTNTAQNIKLKSSATYKISDNFSVFGGIGLEDFRGNLTMDEHGEDNELSGRFLYDAGFIAGIGNLGIQLGISRKMDFKSPKDKFDNVIYVMFSSSF